MTNKIEVSREQLRQEFEWSASDRAWFVHGGTVEDDTAEGFVYGDFTTDMCWTCYFEGRRKAVAATEAPRQEPVAWGDLDVDTCDEDRMLITDKDAAEVYDRQCYKLTPLYTVPLSPDHSGGAAEVVLPGYHLASIGKPLTEEQIGFNLCIDWVKELNQ